MPRKIYLSKDAAKLAAAQRNRSAHYAYAASVMPWRVVVDGIPVAVFVDERDARGFAKARYGEEATVEKRNSKGGRPRKWPDPLHPHTHRLDQEDSGSED